MAADTINISRLIDERPLSPLQKRVIALCGLVVLVEGYGTQLPGFVAPALTKAFSLSPADLTVFFAVGLVGLMLGALIVAPLADRIGRRWVLLGSVFMFGLSSLATAASTSIVMLDVLRFVAGVGIGGALPTAVALTCEYSPHKRRSLMVVVMFNGFILGALTVGLVSAWLVPILGWQSIFIIAGMAPLLMVPILEAALPESPRFLAARKDRRAQMVKLLHHLDPALQIGEQTVLVSNEESTQGQSVASLFRDGRARTTLLLWTISFMSLLDLFLITYWLPTEMRALGAPVGLALLVGAIFQIGGLTGTFFGWMADRFGAGPSLSLAYHGRRDLHCRSRIRRIESAACHGGGVWSRLRHPRRPDDVERGHRHRLSHRHPLHGSRLGHRPRPRRIDSGSLARGRARGNERADPIHFLRCHHPRALRRRGGGRLASHADAAPGEVRSTRRMNLLFVARSNAEPATTSTDRA